VSGYRIDIPRFPEGPFIASGDPGQDRAEILDRLKYRAVTAFMDGEPFECSRDEFQFLCAGGHLSESLPPGELAIPPRFMGQRVVIDRA
jgi:hypothetical protein